MIRAIPAGRWRRGAGAVSAVVLLGAAALLPMWARARAAGPPSINWELLEPGLEFASVPSPISSDSGVSRIRILRIDPSRFELQLLNSSASPDGARFTAREWAQRYGLVAVINASLYQSDHRTSVSLMKS